MYRFEVVTDSPHGDRIGKILSYPHPFKIPETQAEGAEQAKRIAYFRGALLRLFGEPNENTPAIWEYYIRVTDSYGHTLILTAYFGDSGPAIGGDDRLPQSREAGLALLQLIDQTVPADFDVTFYADEYESTVHYGCKDGVCFYEETRDP